MSQTLRPYKGKALEKSVKVDKQLVDAYLPSKELVDAVNLAIQLERPLLIMGEPGCGKTRLAEAVAYELHKDKINDHYLRWDIKSTTKAKDGIYQFDALKRLYDANFKTTGVDIQDMKRYITEGPLAEAFTKKQNANDAPNVLLIDEIDKADIDFPNDLLLELDKKEYIITEWNNKKVQAKSKVLIFVTSNQEKELPPAFLRRCLYHFIEFPDRETLKSIVRGYISGKEYNEELIEKGLDLFEQIRQRLDDTDKKPSTSELIDWFKMLTFYKTKASDRDKLDDDEQRLIDQIDKLESADIKNFPFKQILLKTRRAKEKIENE